VKETGDDEGTWYTLPTCRFCGRSWHPRGLVASEAYCSACRVARAKQARELRPPSQRVLVGDRLVRVEASETAERKAGRPLGDS